MGVELFALDAAGLGAALEEVLKTLAVAAARAEAVFDVVAGVSVPPTVAEPGALERVARDLWRAGLRVRFGPSWTPAPPGPVADVYVGGGDGSFEEHPTFAAPGPRWGA